MALLLGRCFFTCRADVKRVVTATQSYCSSVVSGRQHINGVDLYFEQTGRGKHAVLLFPGAMGCTRTNFGPQKKALNKDRFTLVGWDPHGYGRSRPPARDFINDMFERDADDGVALMKALGYDKFSVLGWSAGAASSMIAAAKNPNLIRQLISVGGFSFVDQNAVAFYKKVRRLEIVPTLMKELEDIYGKEYCHELWREGLDSMPRYVGRPGGICLDFLPQITCPTLLFHGDSDEMSPLYQLECLHKNIKGSRVHIVPGGQHPVHLTHADLFNKAVEDFLED